MPKDIYAFICEDQEIADQIMQNMGEKVTYATVFDESKRTLVVDAIDNATA